MRATLYLRTLVLCGACIIVRSCGGSSFIGLVSNPGGNSISGTVSSASNGLVSGPSGTSDVTLVTFIGPETEVALNFCGEQGGPFQLTRSCGRTIR